MAGNTNFPTALDDDTSLHDVTDNVTALVAAHHNNLKEGLKAVQAKMGVYDTAVPTSLDYRLGHPTNSHIHSGASGQGRKISYSDLEGAPSAGAGGLWATHAGFGDRMAPLFPATYQHVGHPTSYAFLSLVPTYWPDGMAMRYVHPTHSGARAYIGLGRPTFSGATYADITINAGSATFAYIILDNQGYAGIAGDKVLELVVNDYTEGGNRLAKHYFYGGWGLVLPMLATSGIIATYSEVAQMYYDDANNLVKVWTGATWRSLAFV